MVGGRLQNLICRYLGRVYKHTATDAFNNYFTKIGSNLADGIPNSNIPFGNYLNAPLCSSFMIYPATAGEIETPKYHLFDVLM